jgi:hypothetical protein
MPITDMDGIQPLVDAVEVHRTNYNSGPGTDYSVTTLLNPPRIVHLEKRHLSKIKRYVKEQLGSFIGTAIHEYLERCLNKMPTSAYRCEERLSVIIEDRWVSGAYDFVRWNRTNDDEDMWDLKTTSTWKAIFGDKLDWTAQQNMYRYLYWYHYKRKLKTIRILAMFMDWSAREMQRYGGKYPREKAVEYSLARWDVDETYKYMVERVKLMKAEEDTPDDDLPLCTYEDMWSKPDKYAVHADNRKNALRVCDSEAQAAEWTAAYLAKDTCKHKFDQLSLECRPAVRTRCESWCPCNIHCSQYQDYLTALAVHNGGSKS